MSNPYLKASEEIASAVTTLPKDFVTGNAAVLYQIVNELERSHTAELKLLGPLRHLKLNTWRDGLFEEVQDLAVDLEDEHGR